MNALLGEAGFEKREALFDDLIKINLSFLLWHLAGKDKNLTDDLPGIQRGGQDLLDVLSCLQGEPRALFCKLTEPQDVAQRFVQFMSHTGSQLSNGCQAIRVPELFLEPGLFVLCLLSLDNGGDLLATVSMRVRSSA